LTTGRAESMVWGAFKSCQLASASRGRRLNLLAFEPLHTGLKRH
jgi:hypothetical protein